MNRYNLYIGTLKTNEQEFEDCKRLIAYQTYTKYEHFVFENLPNKDSHYKLFEDFLSKRDKFDILIKVDADTILIDEVVFEYIVDFFTKNKKAKHLQLRLYDFFTQTKIWGLNSYRNNIELGEQDNLFTDRFIKFSDNESVFQHKVIGIHSPNPSDYQAFHYGIHRQLKNQIKQVIIPMFKSYLKTFNRKRALALIGVKLVMENNFSRKNIAVYEDETVIKHYNHYKNKHGLVLFFLIISSFVKFGLGKTLKAIYQKFK